MPLMKQLTRYSCCCGMENTGMRAFGRRCEACPKKGWSNTANVFLIFNEEVVALNIFKFMIQMLQDFSFKFSMSMFCF